ncbi:MAG: 4-(cytidine 5'-diphospho)-2-C-methyl-D-erythritol kinase [Muribaculaceae bacterium]|nr:4-(cytidine 5'-diphospho)-2-C-methyl-D-erythritol kinase [Muribaculaceae bacterium]
MIRFVNAKINIGLNVVAKRQDGYHDLETVFYPVGLECGLPHQPQPFDDILEVGYQPGDISGCRFQFLGRPIDCPPKKNLVVKAASLFLRHYNEDFDDLGNYGMFEISLDKHLPDGAGLGGGSADAAFTLQLLNETVGKKYDDRQLAEMALKLGADCPFFLYNKPCFAEGIGEVLNPINLSLEGYTLLIVKPDIHVSTADAFAGIVPKKPEFDLRFLPYLPIEDWKNKVVNDFESTVFAKHPELGILKQSLYDGGAIYASMTGSGSAIYALFDSADLARKERTRLESTYQAIWLFGL